MNLCSIEFEPAPSAGSSAEFLRPTAAMPPLRMFHPHFCTSAFLKQCNPGRGVITAFFPAPNFTVDTGPNQNFRRARVEQEVINSYACIASKRISEIVPERADCLFRV